MRNNIKRLIFDISFIDDLPDSVTGISRVILSLINEIIKGHSSEIELLGISFNNTGENYKLYNYDYIQKKSKSFLIDKFHDSNLNIEDGDIILLLGEQWLFPNCIASIQRIKVLKNIKIVSMLYDFVPFIMPEFYWPNFPENYEKIIKDIVSITDCFLFISEHTKKDFIKFFPEKVFKDRLYTIRLGDNINISKKSIKSKKKNYILTVSTIQPRKNHMLLLYIWKRLIEDFGYENTPILKIIGKKGWNMDSFFYYIENSPILKEKIQIIESVTEIELDRFYKESIFTVYPSFYEGWGLPICESLSYGKLCLSSSTSSMKEAGGNLFKYFSPYSTDELYNLIVKYYFNSEELENEEKKIEKNYKSYSWLETSKELLDIIEKV
jgi:glycosyltransferase involved in cell wall biosynthesis